MTPEQTKLARHALGLDNPDAGGRSYRNRYFALKGSPADVAWQAMSDAGDADYVSVNRGTERQYWLTRQGAEKVLQRGERLDPEDFPDDEVQANE